MHYGIPPADIHEELTKEKKRPNCKLIKNEESSTIQMISKRSQAPMYREQGHMLHVIRRRATSNVDLVPVSLNTYTQSAEA